MAAIRQRAGRWQARVSRRGLAPETKSFASKEGALRWARAVEAEMDRGGYISHSAAEHALLGDVLQRYALEVSPSKRGGRDEVIRLRAMARTRLAKLSMAMLSAKEVARYRDERLQQVAPSTIVRDLAMLSSAINHARREWGISISNPVSLVRKPNPGRGRDRVLEAGEELRLLEALKPAGRRNHWTRAIVVLALETAMQ